jgi:hypothetical protein
MNSSIINEGNNLHPVHSFSFQLQKLKFGYKTLKVVIFKFENSISYNFGFVYFTMFNSPMLCSTYWNMVVW